jgi:hypothetical protein
MTDGGRQLQPSSPFQQLHHTESQKDGKTTATAAAASNKQSCALDHQDKAVARIACSDRNACPKKRDYHAGIFTR